MNWVRLVCLKLPVRNRSCLQHSAVGTQVVLHATISTKVSAALKGVSENE